MTKGLLERRRKKLDQLTIRLGRAYYAICLPLAKLDLRKARRARPFNLHHVNRLEASIWAMTELLRNR